MGGGFIEQYESRLRKRIKKLEDELSEEKMKMLQRLSLAANLLDRFYGMMQRSDLENRLVNLYGVNRYDLARNHALCGPYGFSFITSSIKNVEGDSLNNDPAFYKLQEIGTTAQFLEGYGEYEKPLQDLAAKFVTRKITEEEYLLVLNGSHPAIINYREFLRKNGRLKDNLVTN